MDRLVPQDTMVAVPVIQGHVDRLVLAICIYVLTRKRKVPRLQRKVVFNSGHRDRNKGENSNIHSLSICLSFAGGK